MRKVKYGLLIGIFFLVSSVGFFSVGKMIYVKYTGKRIETTVCKVPNSCDRYNHINVFYNGVEYEVSISRSDCRTRLYKVGQKVILIKNENYQDLVWPESQVELIPFVFVAVFILAFLSYKK